MINWAIQVSNTLPSTQDVAMARAAEGAPEGTVIQALSQSGGRGRHGNQWISPPGNLYMSFILRPMCTPDLAGQISFVVALALSAAMEPYTQGHKKTLKWPNDVLIDGKKCAGILLESNLSAAGIVESLVVGMGVNILSAPEERIGLAEVAGPEMRIPILRFRDEVLIRVAEYYEGWKGAGFEPVRRDWLAQAHGLNHKISARLPDRTEKGIFRDLGPDGALRLETGTGETLNIRAGEVFFQEI